MFSMVVIDPARKPSVNPNLDTHMSKSITTAAILDRSSRDDREERDFLLDSSFMAEDNELDSFESDFAASLAERELED
jgi:hypothetical protein